MPRYYLLAMTLGMHVLVQHLLRIGNLTGGHSGLGRIPAPAWFGTSLEAAPYLLLVCFALGLCIVVDRWFWYSRFGQVLRDALAVQTDTAPYACREATLVAFVTSTAMAGLAGSLFAHFEVFISPFDFDLDTSLFMLALVTCGGLGSLYGAILGTLLLGGILEIAPALASYRLLGSGMIFLIVGLWFPRGLLTLSRRRYPRTTATSRRQAVLEHSGQSDEPVPQ
jgi:branched-chain amino acid transport system permease protein